MKNAAHLRSLVFKLVLCAAGIMFFLLAFLSRESRSAGVSLDNRVYMPVVTRSYDASVPPSPTPVVLGASSRFGIWITGGDSTIINYVANAGAKWTRAVVLWSRIQPAAGPSYNFSVYDDLLSSMAAAGLNPIVEIRSSPGWAAPTKCGPISDLDAFEGFLRAMATRYSQPQYNVKHWEFYNEPDNRDVTLGETVGGCWGNNPAEYAAMLQRATTAIKGVDAEAKIVMGGLALDVYPSVENNYFNMNFADQFLAAGGGGAFDVMNIHYFSSQSSNWSTYGRDIAGKVGAIRQVMANRGVSKPILITELSWTSGDKNAPDYPEMQARYVPKALARSLAIDLYAVTWFNLVEWVRTDWPYGLMDAQRQPRDSYTAYQVAVAEFAEAASVRPLSPTEADASSGIEGYVFVVGGQERWVLWAEETAVLISLPGRATAAKNKLGQAIQLAGAGNPTNLLLTADPIHVRLGPS